MSAFAAHLQQKPVVIDARRCTAVLQQQHCSTQHWWPMRLGRGCAVAPDHLCTSMQVPERCAMRGACQKTEKGAPKTRRMTCCAVPAAGSVHSTFTSPGVAVGSVE